MLGAYLHVEAEILLGVRSLEEERLKARVNLFHDSVGRHYTSRHIECCTRLEEFELWHLLGKLSFDLWSLFHVFVDFSLCKIVGVGTTLRYSFGKVRHW